jgi:hypothetical protein
MRLPCLLALGLLGLVPLAAAQGHPTGVVGLTADSLPRAERPDGGGEQGAHELRWHATARSDRTLGRLRLSASGFFDALVARRSSEVITTAAIVRPEDVVAELRFEKADVRLGYGRVIWGRLDEMQPTDVISPIDLTRFFLDGRSEARMAVAHARARFIPSDRLQVEAVLVPQFRPSTFDQLDETSSPFSLRPTRVCGGGLCAADLRLAASGHALVSPAGRGARQRDHRTRRLVGQHLPGVRGTGALRIRAGYA